MTGTLHIAAAGAPRVVCVLAHGRGQSPEDMRSHIVGRLGAAGVAFVLPRSAGKGWYAAKAVDPLTDATRAELDASLAQLTEAVEEARRRYPGLPLLLAGFSQGACLSLEYVCGGYPAPAAVLALTGCRVGVASDDRTARLPEGLQIWLTGSDDDPWIPLSAFADAAENLGRQKARLRAELVPGRAHEVSDPEIGLMRQILFGMAGANELAET